jgi:hypothetical protein
MSSPKCFISYSWDSTSHKDWIRFLAEQLQENAVEVFLDQWDLHPGDDLPHYMESSIREADFVLLVCTQSFAMKANAGTGGVGYEKTIVTGEIFQSLSSPGKFIPILRNGTPRESLPSYLKSKLFVDFRSDSAFSSSFEELLRHLYSSPLHIRPPKGKKPSFRSPSIPFASIPEPSTITAHSLYCQRCGATPGQKSECNGPYTSHDFVSLTGSVYCQRCGATPGQKSECNGPYTSHDFKSV